MINHAQIALCERVRFGPACMIAIRPIIRSPIYIFLVSPHRLDRRSTELDCYMLQEVGRRSLWDALSWETLWEY
jgi:hypothetical protein